MEIIKKEVELIEKVTAEAQQEQFVQLTELQLAFVGGGVGEATLG